MDFLVAFFELETQIDALLFEPADLLSEPREVISCICGTDFVVVARLRAAAVAKVNCGCPFCGC
ncbi:MAG: hypothetical protein ACRDQU_06275 [Pseudonocardiaceae bacterium]